MSHSDQWNHDPDVQMMRRIFSLMEKFQEELLKALNLSSFDPRLRRARYCARDLFEQTWPLAMQKGIVVNETEAALLYRHCLSLSLKWSGMEVADQVLPENDRIARFLQEKLR